MEFSQKWTVLHVPDTKDHQKTDSEDPGYFFGPNLFRLAKRGK